MSLDVSTGKLDPSRCPLCGQTNQCGMAAGATSCWCFDTKIPADVLEKLPPEARELACVCRACATGADGAPRSVEELYELFRRR